MVNIDYTSEQLEVINSRARVKRVIACAGAGKTWVITKSIIEVLKKNLCSPMQILGLTFTKNAAENMRKRIRDNVSNITHNELDIFTFNAFGNEIIKENSFKLGLGKDYKILSSAESWRLIYEVFRNYSFNCIKIKKSPGKAVQDILFFIESLKNNLVSGEEFKNYLTNHENILNEYKSKALMREDKEAIEEQKELLSIYNLYESFKKENNSVDYADQVYLPYFLLLNDKNLHSYYAGKYKYIFVDEFQDTNIAQAYLLSMLNSGKNNITVVGDDDQGIYSFRGACVENILNFHEWENFKNSKVDDFYLTTNFRSGAGIISIINDLIKKNENRFPKKLKPSSKSGHSEIIFLNNPTHDMEAEKIAKMIKKLDAEGMKLKDIAIFARAKNFSQITKKLDDYNVKYELIGSKTFYYEREVLFIIAWLYVIYDIFDEIHLTYLLKSDKYKIGDRDIFFLKRDKNGTIIDLIEGIGNSGSNPYISLDAKKRLSSFINELKDYISKSKNFRLKELISFIYKNSGLKDDLNSSFGPSSRKKVGNIETLIKVANDFEEDLGGGGLESFNTYLKDVAKTDFEGPDSLGLSKENSVKIMSIHAAKGLEFEAVFLPMLWKKDYIGKRDNRKYSIPSNLRKDSKIWKERKNYTSRKKFKNALKQLKTEEERRIFYVACSRAKKLLVLSHSDFEDESDRSSGKSKKLIVPFFSDIAGNQNIKLIKEKDAGFVRNVNQDSNHKVADFESIIAKLDIGGRIVPKTIDINWEKVEKDLVKELDKIKVSSKKTNPEVINTDKGKADKFYSLTNLLEYMKCPRLYQWKNAYKIPGPVNKSLEIGEKVHFAIEKITNLKLKNKEIEEEKLISNLEEELRPYVKTYINSDFFKLDKVRIMGLEQLIYLQLDGHIITTKLDRLDKNGHEGFRVIDYKISSHFKKNILHLNQLQAYALAVADIYNSNPEDITCILFYLKDNKSSNHVFQKEKLDSFKGKLLDIIREINLNKFPAKKNNYCKNCHYNQYCRV
ncbi:MAG: ATP-dependent DNA helicase [Actinomycetota bacterium]